jgi:TRAP transporter 4TM/12TM fusion protein
MAEFLSVSYFQVTLWALIPAVLYYVAVFYAVHFEAKRVGLAGLPDPEVPRLAAVMRERGHMFLPILVMLVGLFSGYSAPLCALAATLSCVPAALLRKTTRANVTWRGIVSALEDGAKQAIPVALACAAAGLVIGSIALTGAGIKFTSFVLALTQDSLVLALVLMALAGIVLGMGMPTTPAYIVMVALLVPAIAKLGVIPPAAHMFAFYFAILSAITPPVALAVYAAAGLAKANMWTSGWAAMRAAAPAYIVPFMFAYEPALLMIGDWTTIAHATASATIGTIALAAGMFGYLLRPCRMWERALLVTAAVLLIKPGLVTDAIGLALLAGVAGAQWLALRRAPGAAKA